MKILEQTHDQFADAFLRRYGKGTHYSTPVYRHVMQTGGTGLDRLPIFSQMPELAGRLQRDLVLDAGPVVNQVEDHGVIKFVTRLADGLEIESVVIPMFRRFTLCVSSQVGCRMGCRFCRTGKMGLMRHLTTAEIVGQAFAARHRLGVDVRNVVFMGMGEPLDNLESVMQAIRVLGDQRGLDIARRHMTVSTAGLIDGIDRLARIDGAPVNLAVSLNAPNDAIRSRLMPVNRAMPMADLQAALQRYPLSRKGAIFVEYVLIEGINDQQAHARALARYLAPLNAKLNLIPYNPAPGSDLKAPSPSTYERFLGWLVAERVFVRRRGEKGSRIMAACGQLGGRECCAS
ncbi:dual-specificity RNA methyltransferase RlmN [Desulfosarcina ovata subsp. sediminis]|uniref:Dual-specificity RNA methyltransferase RlmN n=1 Tax=Desulfosarcina ovata subsp. sediminis TaxID=885957 RepID=A0A5K7ZTP6_9BACT|nr:23S rRNA (adenine(2503)-C(2))-methyltransferase RlmN [Desulfosarcina ovata]BBO83578.1 dual-specificity RNA methyltransferase RlmN [Desulfosarcina ovata subsp. sediminis]